MLQWPMCLAIPGKLVEIRDDGSGLIEYGGTRRAANLSFVDAKVGDWVVVHAGFAMQVLDEDAAKETLDLWREALELDQSTGEV